MSNKRILHEIEELQKDAMKTNHIFYRCDESNFRKGKALIIGPEGTPYAYCPLVFDIELPPDYPLSCPKVTFMTSDGQTRFHPNLYVTGKVCLSILGTWKGPAWSAAITLSKMLLTIQSILDANPIANEPTYESVTLSDVKAKAYSEFVESRLVSLSFKDLLRLKRGECPPIWEELKDILLEQQDELIAKLFGKIETHTEDRLYTGLNYSLQGHTDWLRLKELAFQAGITGSEPTSLLLASMLKLSTPNGSA